MWRDNSSGVLGLERLQTGVQRLVFGKEQHCCFLWDGGHTCTAMNALVHGQGQLLEWQPCRRCTCCVRRRSHPFRLASQVEIKCFQGQLP